MIESIVIANVATYDTVPVELNGLSRINFLFGSNGTGKTTVSRVIADAPDHPTCKVTWKAGRELHTMVYNRDFVERNFNQSEELKGVFTLGEQQVDTLAKITTAKRELDALTIKIETLTRALKGVDGAGGKESELAALEAALKSKCWAQKQKHDANLKGAFEGFRNNSEKFREKVLQEYESNRASLLTLADLERKAETVFGPAPAPAAPVAGVNIAELIAHETNPTLRKRVIGKEDVDIAAMIEKLGNSDWVRQGRAYYEVNEAICPFCQQSTTEEFAKSLSEYFDETFIAESAAIDILAAEYAADAERLQQQLETIIALPSRFLDVDKLKVERDLLGTKIMLNAGRLAAKKKETSQVVELEPLGDVAAAINGLIDAANIEVAAHNEMVSNLTAERRQLTAQVWRFVAEELKVDLAAFTTAKHNVDKAINAISAQITTATADRKKTELEIRELEKQTTSVQPTIDAINQTLASFGFRSFKLARSASGTSYKLVRSDGADAKATLSEGEKTFVTFLYFYHLLKGSDSDSGTTTDRVVVFDDPVSSLDSDILFIVGSLIKGLFEEVKSGVGHVKQVFVLTHNVYFHKEVTYSSRRKGVAMNEETFWIVRKPAHVSKIERYATNPIKTSYELLWAEVRKPDRSNLGIQNTLRRILENYFKILGGVEFEDLCALFVGKERLICKSLFSWVHDGSHYAHDDLYISIDDSTVDSYLRVFRAIFEKADHAAHYRMMMGDAFVDEAGKEAAQYIDLVQAPAP